MEIKYAGRLHLKFSNLILEYTELEKKIAKSVFIKRETSMNVFVHKD